MANATIADDDIDNSSWEDYDDFDFDNSTGDDGGTVIPPLLEGSPTSIIGPISIILIAGLVALGVLGLLIDKVWCKDKPFILRSSRTRLWARFMVWTSYMYLVPGLFAVLFSFNLRVKLPSGTILGVDPGGGIGPGKPITETMVGLVETLWTTGGQMVAVLVVFYAMAIPALKIILLSIGTYAGDEPSSTSRRCFWIVQNISKWACPDLFAYILLMQLIEDLGGISPYVVTASQMDLGYTCFSLFCIGSSIASLGYRVPDREHALFQRIAVLLGGKEKVVYYVAVLTVVFFGLFIGGIVNPAMGVELGELNATMQAALESLGLTGKIKAHIGIGHCTKELVEDVLRGHVTSIISFNMLLVFVIIMPALDMILLLMSAVRLKAGSASANGGMTMARAWICKKLAMLDVAIMGIVVVSLAMTMYRQYLVVKLHRGLWLSLIAEGVHYFTYYLVKATFELELPELELGDPKSDDECSDTSVEECSGEDEELNRQVH